MKPGFFFYALKKCAENRHLAPKKCSRLSILATKTSLFVEFKGALTEQFVLQQIICETPYTPYYYGTDKATFEQDFLLQIGMDAVPVEVKAETNVRSQSLKAFYDKFHPEKSIRFSLLPYKDQEWMVNIPLYAVCNL